MPLQAGAQIVLSTVQLVLAGIGIGIVMAAPIGPVNVLVIQRAVAGGFCADNRAPPVTARTETTNTRANQLPRGDKGVRDSLTHR